MKISHAAAKLDAGADEKHDINFHWWHKHEAYSSILELS